MPTKREKKRNEEWLTPVELLEQLSRAMPELELLKRVRNSSTKPSSGAPDHRRSPVLEHQNPTCTRKGGPS